MIQQRPDYVWTGRKDTAEGEHGRRWHEIVTQDGDVQAGDVVLIGFGCDAGVRRNGGRPGAADGPTAIRAMLANLPAWPGLSLRDAGDVTCQGDALEEAQMHLAAQISHIVKTGAFPIALGGGHEIAFASFSGLFNALPHDGAPQRIGIVNLDAHLDLRADPRPSSGTPFLQAARLCAEKNWPFRYACYGASLFANTQGLFHRAAEHGVDIMLDDEMVPGREDEIVNRLQHFCETVDHIYLTIDLDTLPAGSAPGVSAPAARGVEPALIELAIDTLAATGKLKVADIAEMNPLFDIDGRTARIAARFVARLAARRSAMDSFFDIPRPRHQTGAHP